MRGCRLDQVRRPGPRVADEVRLTRRARLLEEAAKNKNKLSFRVCVSVALVSTTPDPREPSPRVESKFPTRGEGSCCVGGITGVADEVGGEGNRNTWYQHHRN